jgi:hypothetical protein
LINPSEFEDESFQLPEDAIVIYGTDRENPNVVCFGRYMDMKEAELAVEYAAALLPLFRHRLTKRKEETW